VRADGLVTKDRYAGFAAIRCCRTMRDARGSMLAALATFTLMLRPPRRASGENRESFMTARRHVERGIEELDPRSPRVFRGSRPAPNSIQVFR